MKRFRPTPEKLAAARGRTVADLLAPDLEVLFVGINPSLYSAAVRHHFARPGNRFWPALHGAGFTASLLDPSSERMLLRLGYGITNLVDRATARADELAAEEFPRGARRLVAKIRKYRVRRVAFLGVTAYNLAFGKRGTSIGRQHDETVEGAAVWVLPNPSGLNAHYQLPALVRIFGELRQAVLAEK